MEAIPGIKLNKKAERKMGLGGVARTAFEQIGITLPPPGEMPENYEITLTTEQKLAFHDKYLELLAGSQQERIENSGYGNIIEKTQRGWDNLDKTKTGKATKVVVSTVLIGGATLLAAYNADMVSASTAAKKLLVKVGVAASISTAINMALTSDKTAKFISYFRRNKNEASAPEVEAELDENTASPEDLLYRQVVEGIRGQDHITMTSLQRDFHLNRTQVDAILQQLEEDGVIGPAAARGQRPVIGDIEFNDNVAGGAENTNAHEEKESLMKRYLTLKNLAIALGIGATWWISGPIMAAVAIGGASAKKIIDKLFVLINKKLEEKKGQAAELLKTKLFENDDPIKLNEFIAYTIDRGEELDRIESKLNNRKLAKGILNGAATAAVGLTSLTVHATELDKVTTGDLMKGNFSHEEVAEGAPVDEVVNTPTPGESNPVTKEPEIDWVTGTPKEDVAPTPETGRFPYPNPDASVSDPNNPITTPGAGTGTMIIPETALVDGKHNIGITYAFKSQLEADPKLAESLGYDKAPNKAAFLADLGKKLGYIGENGDVRVKAEGGAAYVLTLDSSGNPMVQEYQNGVAGEIHNVGYQFEPTGTGIEKDYEYYHEKVRKAFEGNHQPGDIDGVPVETQHQDVVHVDPVPNETPIEQPEEELRRMAERPLGRDEVRFATEPAPIAPRPEDQMWKPTQAEIIEGNNTGRFAGLEGKGYTGNYAINPTYGGYGSYEVGTQISADNPFGLKAEDLKFAHKVEDFNFDQIFTSGKDKIWETVRDDEARDIMTVKIDANLEKELVPFTEYMQKLKELSGLEPHGPLKVPPTPAETNEQYIERAIQKIVQLRKEQKLMDFVEAL